MTAISIIIPLYNQEAYVANCLDSIMQQTFSDFEVIIVDDGSTDSSAAIAEQYLSDPRIILIRQSNSGVSSARNSGMHHAQGQWLCFIDPDDFVQTEYLETLYRNTLMPKTPEIVISACRVINNQESHSEFFFPHSFVARTNEEKLPFMIQLMDGQYMQNTHAVTAVGVPWGKLYRHDFIRRNNLWFNPQEVCMEDNIFNMKAFNLASCIVYTKYDGYCYRTNSLWQRTLKHLRSEKFQPALNARAQFMQTYPLADDPRIHSAFNSEKVTLYFQEVGACATSIRTDSYSQRLVTIHSTVKRLQKRLTTIDPNCLSLHQRIKLWMMTNLIGRMTFALIIKYRIH